MEDLLTDLGDRRKHEMYGDIDLPDENPDPEDVVADIERYFEAVEGFLGP